MKKTIALAFLLLSIVINACTPEASSTSTPLPGTEPTTRIDTQVPSPVPTAAATPTTSDTPTAATTPTAVDKHYQNEAFGLSFRFPSTWFGPSEYVSGETLRVEVGSDTVYPYGEPPETPSSIKNSYNVVVQYSKNNQSGFWKDTFQSLIKMKDGESVSGIRDTLIRVREVNLGRFSGYEFISTLSETAQTEPVYTRSIILVDESTGDVLNIMGSPNNVEVPGGSSWRDVYRSIDEANLPAFQGIADSITIE